MEEGQKCNEFTIPTDDGEFELNNKTSLNTIIFFFPRANTSGCTKQANEFSDLIHEFTKLNTQVIGISKDKR